MRKTSALLAATTLAGTVAAVGIALPATASAAASATPGAATATAPAASAPSTVPVPTFDYSDCPQLPAGVNPAKWRCEVLVAEGTMSIGGSTVPFHFTGVTHAEGPMPDGTPGQVFGAFRAATLPVPGRQSGDGHGPKLWMRPRLVTPPDFYSGGEMSLSFELSGPRLPDGCSIGTDAAPVQVAAGRVPGTTRWISQNPPIITFDVQDAALTVPETSGCGRFAGQLNRRFGLPSPSGANRLDGTAFYSFKTYDQL